MYIKRRKNDIFRELLSSMEYNIDSINNAIGAGTEFDEKYFSNQAWIYNWQDEKNWLIGHYNAIAKCVDEKNDYLTDKLFMLTFDTYEYVIYPEVIEVLETLKDNYKLGIISNSLPNLDWSFDTLGIRKYFDSVIISAYEGVDKPSETIYFSAINKLGCEFEECIFIDDKIENDKLLKT